MRGTVGKLTLLQALLRDADFCRGLIFDRDSGTKGPKLLGRRSCQIFVYYRCIFVLV